MRPNAGAGDGRKPLPRLTGGGVFFRESRDDCLTENLHDPMFPFVGTVVKGIAHTPLNRGCRRAADLWGVIRNRFPAAQYRSPHYGSELCHATVHGILISPLLHCWAAYRWITTRIRRRAGPIS